MLFCVPLGCVDSLTVLGCVDNLTVLSFVDSLTVLSFVDSLTVLGFVDSLTVFGCVDSLTVLGCVDSLIVLGCVDSLILLGSMDSLPVVCKAFKGSVLIFFKQVAPSRRKGEAYIQDLLPFLEKVCCFQHHWHCFGARVAILFTNLAV